MALYYIYIYIYTPLYSAWRRLSRAETRYCKYLKRELIKVVLDYLLLLYLSGFYVIIIPPVFHTHSFIYHRHYID